MYCTSAPFLRDSPNFEAVTVNACSFDLVTVPVRIPRDRQGAFSTTQLSLFSSHLLKAITPQGSSSFLQAGLLMILRHHWKRIFVIPGAYLLMLYLSLQCSFLWQRRLGFRGETPQFLNIGDLVCGASITRAHYNLVSTETCYHPCCRPCDRPQVCMCALDRHYTPSSSSHSLDRSLTRTTIIILLIHHIILFYTRSVTWCSMAEWI